MFDPEVWASVPFHFWTLVVFVFGTIVGSFLNVCIHRMPLEQSVVNPPSHCPHCKYSIPWFLNIPLVTWTFLRGKCNNCGAPISVRYFLVELLTGVAFVACWLNFGRISPLLALAYCVVLVGFIVGTFTDLEHMIVPDEITLGGTVAGFLLSFAVPLLHETADRGLAMRSSLIGIAVSAGMVYLILRGGKLLFGRERVKLEPDSRLIFTDTHLKLPDGREIPYGEILYRDSDTLRLYAKTIELPEICYFKKDLSLNRAELRIGEDTFKPEEVPHMELVTSELALPREAMGLGDVKFMAAVGAFLGWRAAIFTFFGASVIGTVASVFVMALRGREKSGKIPMIPLLVMAATIWIFLPQKIHDFWRGYLGMFAELFRGPDPARL